MWGEPTKCLDAMRRAKISTHSPRVGRTPEKRGTISKLLSFQLTRPVWGEPERLDNLAAHIVHFNSLAPCGANPLLAPDAFCLRAISTHSPRVGRTHREELRRCKSEYFNSLAPCGANLRGRAALPCRMRQFQLTRPVWGEPRLIPSRLTLTSISTHSPRVGRTAVSAIDQAAASDFNSLAPCGANPSICVNAPVASPFQLTRPVWGEPRHPSTPPP